MSFKSPIFHNVTLVNLASGLALLCDDFKTCGSNQPVLCFLSRAQTLDEERYYGRRMSIKPVNSDTIGIPLRDSTNNLASLRLRLVDALTMESPTNSDDLRNYVVCISAYR